MDDIRRRELGISPRQQKKACRMLWSAWTRLNMLAKQVKRGDPVDYKVLQDLTTQFRSYQTPRPRYSIVYPSVLRIWSCLEAVWEIRESKWAKDIRFELLRTAVGAARKAHEHIDPTPFRGVPDVREQMMFMGRTGEELQYGGTGSEVL